MPSSVRFDRLLSVHRNSALSSSGNPVETRTNSLIGFRARSRAQWTSLQNWRELLDRSTFTRTMTNEFPTRRMHILRTAEQCREAESPRNEQSNVFRRRAKRKGKQSAAPSVSIERLEFHARRCLNPSYRRIDRTRGSRALMLVKRVA